MPSGLLSNPGAFLEQDEQELQALKLKRKTFGVSRFWTRSSRSEWKSGIVPGYLDDPPVVPPVPL